MTLGEFGEKLKSLREEKGLSLSDIADKIKISTRMLEHVENGNRDGLPHLVYAKGFIVSYATLLGISPEEIQEFLHDTFDNDIIEDSHVVPGVLTRSMKKKSTSMKWLMFFFLLLVFLFVVGGSKVFKKEFYIFSHIDIAALMKKPFVAASFQHPSSLDNSTAELFLSEKESVATSASTTKEAEDSPTSSEETEQSFLDSSSPTTEDFTLNTSSLTDQSDGNKKGHHLVRLVVDKGQCWVGYEADGHEEKDEMLKLGDTKEYFYNNSLRIILGNPSAVTLWHDGKLFTRTFDGSRREILQFP